MIVKASMPVAMVVLAAGLHMTFAGDWWGAGWPVVSLVAGAIGIALGLVVAMRELGQHAAPIDPAPAVPAS